MALLEQHIRLAARMSGSVVLVCAGSAEGALREARLDEEAACREQQAHPVFCYTGSRPV